jgi:hypothetical protein
MAARVPPKPDAERIERLSGLFRLWGIVKFFLMWSEVPSIGTLPC